MLLMPEFSRINAPKPSEENPLWRPGSAENKADIKVVLTIFSPPISKA
jgi:hypothetical protein